MTRSFLLAACGALLGCGPRLSMTERAVVEQAVRARLDGWVTAINNRSPDGLASFYYRGPELAVAWSDGRRTRGWEQESAAQKEFLGKLSQINFTLSDPVIDPLTAQVAVATYGVSIDMVSNDQRSVTAGQGTSVWVKDPADDMWRIRALQTARKELAPPAQPARRR
ncbi:MAG: nuclear transport factor 2 family protein [Gemmatimonadetes bacterium]|nr:nuclear transport factor 2 family protein [Gemmatimonadota bacterium]